MIEIGNLFAGIPDTLAAEQVTALLTGPNIRIERIASRGHASPPDFWYDQDKPEWVVVLAGSANAQARRLSPHPGACEASRGVDRH